MIGKTIGNNQFAVVDKSAAGINDIGYVALAFVLVGLEQGLAESADHPGVEGSFFRENHESAEDRCLREFLV